MTQNERFPDVIANILGKKVNKRTTYGGKGYDKEEDNEIEELEKESD